MAAANFSRDVLEMFYGPIPNEDNQRLRAPIRPCKRLGFQSARNNFNEWLRVWKMRRQPRPIEIFPKNEKCSYQRLRK